VGEHGIDSSGSAFVCPGSVGILVDIFVNCNWVDTRWQ